MRFYILLLPMLLLSVGCTGSTTDPLAEASATPAVFNAIGAPTVMFYVPDMVCESCSAAVHDTLAAQPGAREVTVDLEQKMATVAVDEETFDEEAAVAALLDKQFSHAKLVGAEKKEPVPTAPEAPTAPEKDSDS